MTNPEERITYGYICEQMPIPSMFFRTYEEAYKAAEFNQPAYRPFYIVERTEHYEICGVVREKGVTANEFKS